MFACRVLDPNRWTHRPHPGSQRARVRPSLRSFGSARRAPIHSTRSFTVMNHCTSSSTLPICFRNTFSNCKGYYSLSNFMLQNSMLVSFSIFFNFLIYTSFLFSTFYCRQVESTVKLFFSCLLYCITSRRVGAIYSMLFDHYQYIPDFHFYLPPSTSRCRIMII